jgi:hypothetical protein
MKDGPRISIILTIVVSLFILTMSAQRSSSPRRPEKSVAYRVAVLGDSITADGGYVNTLRRLCPRYTFHNYGIAGETTTQIARRGRLGAGDRSRKIVGLREYGHLIVLAGVNNIHNVAGIKRDLTRIYTMAKRVPTHTVRVIAVTLSPWGGYSTWTPWKQKNTERINRFILKRPEPVDIAVNIYRPLLSPRRPYRMRRQYFYSGDPLHPRGPGQRVIGRTIFRRAFHASERSWTGR